MLYGSGSTRTASPGLVCPKCNFRTDDKPEVLFCRECGTALCHKCPYCQCRIVTHALGTDPVDACPECGAPLAQCRHCGWVGQAGTTRCENPACPPGSMRNPVAGVECSVLGGDPSRGRFCRIDRPFLARENLARQGLRNQKVPKPKQVEIPGTARFVAQRARVLGVASPPGRFISIHLVGSSPTVEEKPLQIAPDVDLPDCVASSGDRVYVIHHDGAAVWDNRLGVVCAPVPGSFASQLVHPRGWLLVERRQEARGVALHLLDHGGKPLTSGRCAVLEGVSHPEWVLPVGDDSAVYLAAGSGELWKVHWSGETGKLCALNPCRGATLILDGRHLWFLPVGGEYNAARIDLETARYKEVQTGQPVNPLASAVDTRTPSGCIWLGFQERPYLRGVRRDLPIVAPKELPNTAGPVRELAVAADPEGSALLLGLVEGERDVRLQGWWLDEEVEPAGIFDPSYPRSAKVGPHILVARQHALVWYGDGSKTQVFIYELQ